MEDVFPLLLYFHHWPQGGTPHHHTAPNPSRGTAGGAYSVSKLGRLGEPAAVRHRPEQSLFTGTPVLNPRSSDRSSARAPSSPHISDTRLLLVAWSRARCRGFGVLVVHCCGRIKIGSVFSWIRKEEHDVNERRNRLIFDGHRCFFFSLLPNSLHDGTCRGQRHLLIIYLDFSCYDWIIFKTTSTVINTERHFCFCKMHFITSHGIG